MDEEIDFTKLKYVLYARKSTDDPQRQVRSIGDQIFECKQLAARLGITVVKVLEETKSAKKPNQRPIFRQMLNDLKKGVYDGILAWNPDRLSRNMREGGEIIDMIDEEEIKDLKFVTHHFSKDANGKMLLGMSFVLSKQYSDDLSQKVTRGVRRNFAEGKSAIPKHGSIRTEEGYYKPDGKNFELICTAWELRSKGESLEDITKFMNDNDYSKVIKRTGRKVDMDIKILTDIFHDPFYYGILVQAKQTVDLREIYNFQPATTEDIYNQVQELSVRRLKSFNTKRRMAFYPLKAMVRCSFCGHNMVVGPSTGSKGKRYLNYRCDNKLCTRKKKSIRAKEIFNWIYDFLKEGLNLTEADYKRYYKDLTKLTDEKRQKIGIEIHSKQGRLKVIDQEIKERSLGLLQLNIQPTVKKVNEDRVLELEQEKEELNNKIAGLKEQLTDPEQDKLSIDQFLNLSKNAGVIVQSADAIIKDKICREIFLNFTVDEEKVLSYQLKPHFEEMIKHHQSTTSRGPGN